jgi:phosphoesterase RecJ-like protein
MSSELQAVQAVQAGSAASPSAQEVAAFLQRWDSFVFVSHVKPDGDTLGAGLALGIALKRLGKSVAYFQQDPVPRNLRFMADSEFVSREVSQEQIDKALWVFCDMSDSSRAGEFLPEIPRERILVIDHHLGNTAFGVVNYILSEECSTGTCVLLLLDALKVKVTPDIATCLLTTIMTDTGGFMHSNTTAHVLSLSAQLIEAGANRDEITNEIFANKRFGAIRLMGRALDHAKLDRGGRYCWSVVDEPMLAECNADSEDTEEIIGHLRSVEGVEVAALFKSYHDGIRVSLRSAGRINVQAAAARLQGGGHFRAAGLSHDGPIEKAIEDVEAALLAEGLA